MPLYEYRCEGCKKTFEELVFPGDPLPPCPHCGETHTHRILSPVRWIGAGGEGGSPSSCASCHPGPSGCSGCSK